MNDKKRELEEDLDYLRQVDAPEGMGGGRRFVEQYEKDKQKKEGEGVDKAKNYIENKGYTTYKTRISSYGNERLKTADLDSKWECTFVPTSNSRIRIYNKWFKTQDGVILVVKSPQGEVFIRGINLTRDPEYDINAINVLVLQAENTIDSKKGLLLGDNKDTDSTLKKTKSGIWIA